MSLFQIRSMFSLGSATYWSYISNYLQLRLINIPDLRNFLPSVCIAFFSNFSGSAIYLSEKYSTLRRSQFELVLVFLNNLQYSWSLAVTGKKANTTLWKLLYINLKNFNNWTHGIIENFGHVKMSPSCIVMDSLDLRVDQFEASISSLCASLSGAWICLLWFV